MREYGITGTFFVTPEVLERREDLVREIRRKHAVGLHSHSYYQPEFKGWDAESFKRYTSPEKTRMILRDIKLYNEYLGKLQSFRIGKLEVDHTVLKAVSDAGCLYDSSYYEKNYNLPQKLKVTLSYKFRELPVNLFLYGLKPHHLRRDRSVILIHPLTPPGIRDVEVYDEEALWLLMEVCSGRYEFKGIG
jgi:peptidoglycan/xylan/chitin deacetylase (PgdA/CDA1 family)